jgi:hypothetical protein
LTKVKYEHVNVLTEEKLDDIGAYMEAGPKKSVHLFMLELYRNSFLRTGRKKLVLQIV